MTRVWLPLLVVILIGAPAHAQLLGTGASDDVRWLSVGGGVLVAVLPGEGAAIVPSALLRVNITSKLATEVVADFTAGSSGLAGLYQLQAHYTLGSPRQRVAPFLTIGTVGGFVNRRVRERRQPLPTGDVVVRPGYRDARLSAPFGGQAGAGVRVRMTPLVSLEAGGQFVTAEGGGFLGFNVGVVVPVGPHRSNVRR